MPRRARIHLPDLPVHVVQRGHEKRGQARFIYRVVIGKSRSSRIQCSQNRRRQMAYSCLSARLPHTAGRSSVGTLAVNPRLMLRHWVESWLSPLINYLLFVAFGLQSRHV